MVAYTILPFPAQQQPSVFIIYIHICICIYILCCFVGFFVVMFALFVTPEDIIGRGLFPVNIALFAVNYIA